MNMNLILLFIIYGTIAVAMWDEDNAWKRVTIVIVSAMSVTALGAVRYHDGYDNGSVDGMCSVYNSIDKQEGVSIENKPEVCK